MPWAGQARGASLVSGLKSKDKKPGKNLKSHHCLRLEVSVTRVRHYLGSDFCPH